MPEVSYNQAASSGKSFPGAIDRVYLVLGSDDALKREAIHRLCDAALDPAFSDFDRETIDLGAGGDGLEGADDPVVKILAAAGSMPFGSPRRVVTVLSVQRLSKERQEALGSGLQKLGELTLLILVADGQEMEAGRPKGKSVENALKKQAAAVGTVLVCDAPEVKNLRGRAQALFAERGKRCTEDVLEILLGRAHAASNGPGGDLNTLVSETEKLIAYIGDREEANGHDAQQVIPQFAEENIFALMDAVGARDARGALAQCDALLESGEKPDGVAARTFVMLQRHFRLMMLAKYLAEQGVAGRGGLPGDVKDLLSGELVGFAVGQSYRVAQYARQSVKFEWTDLTRGMNRILLSDLMMKGIEAGDSMPVSAPVTEDAAVNLKMLIVDLCRMGRENVAGPRSGVRARA